MNAPVMRTSPGRSCALMLYDGLMAWDTDAQTMAVNVIAKVESGAAWDAINYSDPITIGLMQWYGTRAAALMDKIRTDNPGSWDDTGDLSDLDSQLDSHGVTSSFWTSRYLTGTEGSALKPVLRNNHTAQEETVSSDIDNYRASAVNIGMDPDTHTNSVIFFCVMYHQTPARAIRIVNSAGPNSSLDRLHSVCMNDPVFGIYKTRYNSAKTIIESGTPPTIIDLDDDDDPVSDGSGTGGGGGDTTDDDSGGSTEGSTDDTVEQVTGPVNYVEMVGDNLLVHLNDGQTIWGLRMPGERWVLGTYAGSDGSSVPPPDDEDDPPPTEPPPDDTADELRQTVLQWMYDYEGTLGYTNDYRRRDPENTGWTDCSGATQAAYKTVGVDLGNLTSHQYTQGYRVQSGSYQADMDYNLLRPGDLLYFKYDFYVSPKVTDHVEMWMGDGTGESIGHPGPGSGPRRLSLDGQLASVKQWWVQRHIRDDGSIE